jgi:hypothetical protein
VIDAMFCLSIYVCGAKVYIRGNCLYMRYE